MQKDFLIWHANKLVVHNERPRVFFNEREIWFCYIGENVGFEEDGRGSEYLRPVVVFRKFNKEMLWAVPLTRTTRRGLYYYSFLLSNKVSTAILSQLRLIDAKRLKYKIGNVSDEEFATLKTKIRQLLA